MKYPFQQEIINGKIKRTFSPDVESEELHWHQDEKDRVVEIIQDGGWSFQMENSLPNKLFVAQQIFIPKFSWHRILKGNSELIVEISEN